MEEKTEIAIVSADMAYSSVYSQAKKTIFVVNIRELILL